MKGFERDMLMYEEGREEERKNTERERERAEKECYRANAAEEENRRLRAELERLKKM